MTPIDGWQEPGWSCTPYLAQERGTMSAENRPVFENAEGIAYDESGGVVISAPLLKINGSLNPPVQPAPQPTPEFTPFNYGDVVHATLVSDTIDPDRFTDEYTGSLTEAEWQALPTYYRRGVAQNGIYVAIIGGNADAYGVSADICDLVNAGYQIGSFRFQGREQGTRAIVVFSRSWTEYADASEEQPEWTSIRPEVFNQPTGYCCGADPTYRVIQSPAVSIPVRYGDVLSQLEQSSTDIYHQAPRPINYEDPADNTWAVSFASFDTND